MGEPRYPNYPPNCPPKVKGDGRGTYYRAIKNKESPRDRDFYSPARLREGADMEPCEREAISIFTSLDDARTALRLMKGHPRRFIAQLSLPGNHGVVEPSPDGLASHCNWWIPTDVDPKNYVIEAYGPF